MDFAIFSTVSWDNMDGAHRPVRWARELLKRGHRVLYIEAQPSHRRPASQNLVLVSLPELGLPEGAFRRAWHGIPPGDVGIFVDNLLERLRDFEPREAEPRVALWCDPFVPLVLPFARLRELGYYAVYDCSDDFEALAELGYYFGNSAAERLLLRECDLISVVSTTLLGKFKAWNLNPNIRLLRQGIDLAEFRLPSAPAAPPPDMVCGERTLGFWGLVNDFNVDPDLLNHVAREHPTWTINLIGPVDSDPQQPTVAGRLHAHPNIHLLGEKPHARLAEYQFWFDVTLIPFPPNTFNLSRDPIKVFEYLAGYRPVVSAHTPQLAGMPYVYLADSPADFSTALERALAQTINKGELDAYLGACTWSARLDALLDWIAELPSPRPAPSPPTADQLYPSDELAPRLRGYVALLEQTVDERLAYIRSLERHACEAESHVKQLERTHPLVWLKRAIRCR